MKAESMLFRSTKLRCLIKYLNTLNSGAICPVSRQKTFINLPLFEFYKYLFEGCNNRFLQAAELCVIKQTNMNNNKVWFVTGASKGLGLACTGRLSDAETRNNFDVNVFGALNVIRKALPQMRNNKAAIFSIFLRSPVLVVVCRLWYLLRHQICHAWSFRSFTV